MKVFIPVTRTVEQTLMVEVNIPDSKLLGHTEFHVRSLITEEALAQASNLDFSGKEKSAEYEADVPSARDLGCGFSFSGGRYTPVVETLPSSTG